MLSLSQTTGYAIQALSFLDHRRPRLIREIAEQTGIAKPYLAKIFNHLTNHGMLVAKRGFGGGNVLARPAAEISLLQIVEALEGDAWSRRCLLGMRECSAENCCPAHDMWSAMKEQIRTTLQRISLAEVHDLSRQQHWGNAPATRKGTPAALWPLPPSVPAAGLRGGRIPISNKAPQALNTGVKSLSENIRPRRPDVRRASS